MTTITTKPDWQHFTDATNPRPDNGLALWSADFNVPNVGDKVFINVNGIGPATVTGYLIVGGYLAVLVRLDEPPEWWKKQNGDKLDCEAFGAELLPELQADDNSDGGYGFEHRGTFITNVRSSECGRFSAEPSAYGFKMIDGGWERDMHQDGKRVTMHVNGRGFLSFTKSHPR